MSTRSILLMLLAGSLLLGCRDEPEPVAMRTIPFEPEGVLAFVGPDGRVIRQIAIEIAETDSARARGMMDRRSLTSRQGMLFTFPDAAPRSFWMANTPVPLDIIFVDADSQVVNIAERTTPLSRERVESTGPAQYVVEVRAGFSDRFGLTDSTRVRWRRLPEES
ncbi:MAG: DUF192 domain-containing protein [Bacteroidetes bacterium]|jgi:uncharacterized membrane protein (UPF0127 family)|nr:DUF192 domain-containing protein [Bacteroidota bacterium]